jgi:hypothetical protein
MQSAVLTERVLPPLGLASINQPTKDLTDGGELREAQVDVPCLYSHSSIVLVDGSVTDT